MPELPAAKRPRSPKARISVGAAPSPYAELHCRSNFSFLEGASHPDELVEQAASLGLAALAITDRNSLAGVVRAHRAAKERKLPLIIGAEITPVDADPIVLWAPDRLAYAQISKLITLGRCRAEKGRCHLTFQDVAEHAEGLLAGVVMNPVISRTADPSSLSAPYSNPPQEKPANASEHDDLSSPFRFFSSDSDDLPRYREVFGDRCYALAELRRGDDDRGTLERMQWRAKRTKVPLVAAGDVYYHVPARQKLQDVLTCIREGCTLAQAGERLFPNAERHLRSASQMLELFHDAPAIAAGSLEIAGRCQFSLDQLRYEYPEELSPPGLRPIEYLRDLAWRGARKRYPEGVPDNVRSLLEHELALIAELRYEAYFLTVWDLIRFARSRGILCQGRGSAANSAVCYCLGVTSVDPARIDVLFERFVSKERNEAPDIDIDFEHQRREEVIQYVYEKYGRDRAGMTAEVITYQPRSAIRDVGKALGLSLDTVDRLAKSTERFRHGEPTEVADRFREAGLDVHSTVGRDMLELIPQILDFPRHLSQHVGGMVMTQGPLAELVPIENAAMAGRTVIQWDKDDLDALGILKVDCLALGMLSAIRRCFDLIARHYGKRYTLASVPAEDPSVYDMICRADTIGVFQIESRAQMSMLPRLRPRCYYDLVIEVAIVRPGPIQGDMVHPYLRRRSREEPTTYPTPAFHEVLHKTLGVPLFQEQAMRLAVVAAGFTPGEADQLRRAMAAWRRPGILDTFRKKLIAGFRAHGISEEMAERIFLQIRGFGEYGFPESHAASFALLVYVSAWLKRHYPAAFTASILNSLPMGFYAPAQLVRDARSHGVKVLPADVNASEWECTLEDKREKGGEREKGGSQQENIGAIAPCKDAPQCASRPSPLRNPVPHPHPPPSPRHLRLGFCLVRGMSQKDAERIVAARASGEPFRSIDDLVRRTGVGSGCLAKLAAADALASLELNRRQALWNALPDRTPMPLFPDADEDEEVLLPALAPKEEVVADYRSIGLSLRSHPISFVRDRLDKLKVVKTEELAWIKDGGFVRVAGLVLVRQQPGTAKGFRFVTIEDETGVANLIVKPHIWERYRKSAARASTLLASGTLQRQGLVIHILAVKLEDLSHTLASLKTSSRDFR